MRLTQFSLAELHLAVVFSSVFALLALKTWGGFFFIHVLVSAAILLFVTYMLLVIAVRQHRQGREGDQSGKDGAS
jgi:hypothetical protein